MNSSKFLEQVADYFTSPANTKRLAQVTFILPNKRSAMFLKHYVQQRVKGKAVFMPRFTTFARFIARTSMIAEADRYDSLFLLYQAYRSVLDKYGRIEQAKDFDKFIFWGDMIINDFDEIDKSLADPKKLYQNLNDLKQITADYLTDDQKSVIRELWGDTPLTAEEGRFWLHINHNKNSEKQLFNKFISLWQILGEVYTEFQQLLLKQNIATPGMQARRALENLRKTPVDKFANNIYAFVGHSDLSAAECTIMDLLQNKGAAEFFWDFEPPFFSKIDSDKTIISADNRAFSIIRNLTKRYPMPSDFELTGTGKAPKIDIIGVPSAVGQAKKADNVILSLLNDGQLEGDRAINTAIVLPDEAMLMPLMLGLPKELSSLNITMSLPYSSTRFATLFRAIISMQKNARKKKNKWTFFHKDVLEVLMHPHIAMIAPQESEKIRKFILKTGMFNIEADQIVERCEDLKFVFTPVEHCSKLAEVYQYTNNLIEGMRQAVKSHGLADAMELQLLDKFSKDIQEINDLAEKYQIEMHESTFFILFERIMSSSKIPLTGTPLKGMQIMGVLECRALDFDNIIFLSMSERTFPRRNYVRTMIPNNLRRGYGLAPIEQQESFHAYYFYRALTRAKHATLIYDSRSSGVGGGEMSRYLTQLIYLHDNGNITHQHIELEGEQPSQREILVEKSPRVMAELNAFKVKGGLNISASALKDYMTCPLSFYLRHVKQLREEDEPQDSLTAAQIGNVFHNSVQMLLEEYKGRLIKHDDYDHLIPKIGDVVMEMMSRERYKGRVKGEDMSAEALLVAAQIRAQIEFLFIAEQRTYGDSGVTYIAGEYPVTGQWTVGKHTFNFTMKIDRIDQLADKYLKFIDYKTGRSDSISTPGMANLFSSDHKYHAIFQLMLYAEAYNRLVDPTAKIDIQLYVIKDIVTSGLLANLKFNRAPLDRDAIRNDFYSEFSDLIDKIFDDSTPFVQCEGTDSCNFCQFKLMCGKNIPEPRY